jgi:hypothetical protein
MASDKFEIEPEAEVPRERGCAGGCLKGCFIALLLFIVAFLILGFVVSRNWRDWSASLAEYFIQESLAASNLDPAEKQEIRAELQRPLDALKSGELSREQIKLLGDALLESPLLASLAVTAVETQYFQRSGLSAEEKEAGRIALRRFAHGVIEGKIDEPAMDRVLSHIADRNGNEWKFHETATDEELRALIATAEQAADKADVPQEVDQIDPSDEIRKVIDQVMGPGPVGVVPPANELILEQE